MPCWFTVKILWDIQSLDNSISQKFHDYKVSHSRDIQVRHKSILFSNTNYLYANPRFAILACIEHFSNNNWRRKQL